ncbi:serine hydrolase domain-containing protein [Olivibacter jilunii]|jgi:CubicO group peptidase (beta-lactamase class C family)|uniref:serine hydrolase domain-containing protein n=1 Tax=Olivibacter jilunii TaxID=985016 RepID=UPI0010307F54|nr:serine hydrolase domain-containing protein [Olivibacter jilunii]MCL4642059.1 beta-lactamase family protein [Olivibacter sp. UJ_SKK_5.1]
MKRLILFVLSVIHLVCSALAQSDDRSAAISGLFKGYDINNMAGVSVMVIKDSQIIYNRSFGFADAAHKVPATPHTNYRLASLSKPFTAMAVMILRDERKLSLDDPLHKFFPKIRIYGNQITIRHMLTHTAGLPNYGDLIPPGTTKPLTDWDVLHLVEQQDTAAFKPGQRFEYSNTAYSLLSLIVEKVSGMPYDEFIKQRIFKPLGMTNSTLNVMGDSIRNRAYGYDKKGDSLVMSDQSLYSYVLGDGGVYSSVSDLFKWDQALYTSKLVKSETIDEMFTIKSWENDHTAYGYGWYIDEKYGQKRVSHSGGTSGFSTYMIRYPTLKFSIIILSNLDEGFTVGEVANRIENIYLKGH